MFLLYTYQRTYQTIESKKVAEELVEIDAAKKAVSEFQKNINLRSRMKSLGDLQLRKSSLATQNNKKSEVDEQRNDDAEPLLSDPQQSLSSSMHDDPVPSLTAFLSGNIQVNDISLKNAPVFKFSHQSKMLEKEKQVIDQIKVLYIN